MDCDRMTYYPSVSGFSNRETYQTFFQSRFAQIVLARHQLKLIVYEPITEEVIQWIN